MANTMADRLEMLRFTHDDISYKELAERTGISRQTLSKYEKGELPSSANLIKLADFFHVSTDYLLCRTNEQNCIGALSTDTLSEQARCVLSTSSAYGKVISLLLENPEGRKLLRQIDFDFSSGEDSGWDMQSFLYGQALSHMAQIADTQTQGADLTGDPHMEFIQSRMKDWNKEKSQEYAVKLAAIL